MFLELILLVTSLSSIPAPSHRLEINSVNLKVLRVVVFENMFRSVTVPDALAHAGVVALVTEDLAAQQLGGHGRP